MRIHQGSGALQTVTVQAYDRTDIGIGGGSLYAGGKGGVGLAVTYAEIGDGDRDVVEAKLDASTLTTFYTVGLTARDASRIASGCCSHHVIAPISPAKIVVRLTTPASTMPFATVAATVIEMNAPAKFRTAATPTAIRGLSAPVAIVVARGFAVSWMPFVKSKTSATATTRRTMMSPVTGGNVRP